MNRVTGNYPLHGDPAADPRYGSGLLVDIRAALMNRGFPEVTPFDLDDLERALLGFLYATNHTTPGGTTPVTGEEC